MKKHYSYWTLLHFSKTKALLSFAVKGYLAEIGWFCAFEKKAAVDEHGDPVPWVTYSFIDFIRDRIRKEHVVFEFGSGNSTLFYAKYADKVVAVEHDLTWMTKMSKLKPCHVELIFCELTENGPYSKMAISMTQQFDIIIIDGRDRVNCCMQSIRALTSRGVLILDDSEREQYAEAIHFLVKEKFKHLSFSGISPGLFYRKSTSVFYKENNCLGI